MKFMKDVKDMKKKQSSLHDLHGPSCPSCVLLVWFWRLVELYSPDKQINARKGEVAGDLIDHVDLTRVQAALELVGGNLELEECGFAIGRVELGAGDDRRFEDFDLAPVKGQARAKLRPLSFSRGRIVHLVVEEQILV